MKTVTLELSDELYAFTERLAEEGGVDVQEAVRRLIAITEVESLASALRKKYAEVPSVDGITTEAEYLNSL